MHWTIIHKFQWNYICFIIPSNSFCVCVKIFSQTLPEFKTFVKKFFCQMRNLKNDSAVDVGVLTQCQPIFAHGDSNTALVGILQDSRN